MPHRAHGHLCPPVFLQESSRGDCARILAVAVPHAVVSRAVSGYLTRFLRKLDISFTAWFHDPRMCLVRMHRVITLYGDEECQELADAAAYFNTTVRSTVDAHEMDMLVGVKCLSVSRHGLNTLSGFPAISSLSFQACHTLGPVDLMECLPRFQNLRELDLSGCSADAGVLKLVCCGGDEGGTPFPFLHSLNITGVCAVVNVRDLAVLHSLGPQLTTLTCHNASKWFTSDAREAEGLMESLGRLPHLHKLDLTSSITRSLQSVLPLSPFSDARYFKTLKELILDFCSVPPERLTDLRTPALQKVGLKGTCRWDQVPQGLHWTANV